MRSQRISTPLFLQFAATLLTFLAFNIPAAVRYVDVNSASNAPPYTSWATAATNIQDAVDAAVAGDEVVVTNGIYATGGRTANGANRVAVDKPLTLISLNGPQATVISGEGSVRCVYLTNGASLAGFTLTNGFAGYGAGLWCESTNAVVSNCLVMGNQAVSFDEDSAKGGGAYGGTLNNCTLTGNSASGRYSLGGGAEWCLLNNCTLSDNFADDGGGAAISTLNNCTLSGNRASYGGGASGGTLNNCTLSDNFARNRGGGANLCTLNNCTLSGNSSQYLGGGASGGTLNNCTLTGNSARNAGGGTSGGTLNNCIAYYNTSTNGANYDSSSTLNYCCTIPQPTNGVGNISSDPQLASASRLSAGSPCRGAGSAAYASGTDTDGEAWANPPSIGCDEYHSGAVTGPLSVGMAAAFVNVPPGFSVGFTALIDGRTTGSVWDFGDGSAVTNQPYTSHAWTTPGDYAVVLRGYNESQPNGISATVTVQVVTQPVRVHYVSAENGNPVTPYASWATAATRIQDAVDAATVAGALVLVTNGIYGTGWRVWNRVAVDKPLIVQSVNGPRFTTIRGGISLGCVYLTNGAMLSGFTLTAGGGGVSCGSATAVVSNCVIAANSAFAGGGAYGGTLEDCILSGNQASYGGGAYYSLLHNCTLTGNVTHAFDIVGFGGGGGAYGCTLNNCTLSGNGAFASDPSTGCCGGNGGGAGNSTLNNCIVYFNTAPRGANYYSCTLNYSCTTPQPTNGVGNITNAPLFVDQASGNLRLQSNSPCINAGLNAFAPAGPDLDGNPRIVGGSVDMGAYEFQLLSLIGFGVVSNQFGFNITCQSNWIIVLEASSDFTNWTPLTTNTLGASPFPFRDPTPPTLPRRFYRARLQE